MHVQTRPCIKYVQVHALLALYYKAELVASEKSGSRHKKSDKEPESALTPLKQVLRKLVFADDGGGSVLVVSVSIATFNPTLNH